MFMEGRFNKFVNDQDIGHDNSPENSGDSPPSSILNDTKTTCISSPKRSRRAVQKRVVSVPIRDVEGSRLKGETNAPPSDSWAWRKYGQKPIKGSPYPRGYYRCSSSKGCPARKQVERSRSDPTMVIVTYSSDHNHPWPASNSSSSRTHHNHRLSAAATTTSLTTTTNSADDDAVQPAAAAAEPSPSSTHTFPLKSDDDHHHDVGGGKDLGAISFLTTDQHYQYAEWFSDLDQSTAATTLLESPLMAAGECGVGDADMAMVFSIDREGDESFFADLGELPECTAVFRRRVMMEEEEHRRCNLAPWCGTT